MGNYPGLGQTDAKLTEDINDLKTRVAALEEGVGPDPEPGEFGVDHEPREDYREWLYPIWDNLDPEEWVYGRGPGDDFNDPYGGPWESLPQPANVERQSIDNLRTDREVTGYVAVARDKSIRAEVTFQAQGALKPENLPPPVETDHMDGHLVTWPDRTAATHDAENRLRGGKLFLIVEEHVSEIAYSKSGKRTLQKGLVRHVKSRRQASAKGVDPCATDAGWFLPWYQGGPYMLAITLRGYSWGGNGDAAARGDYENCWRNQIRQIVNAGFDKFVARPFNEMNCCFAWGEDAKRNPPQFQDNFKRYSGVIREEAPEAIIDWCPIFEPNFEVVEKYYPGDDFCDVIGSDTYSKRDQMTDDNLWNSFFLPGLTGHRDFARAHGKPISFPEWAPDRNDDALFVRNMRNWILDPDNNCLYDICYEDDNQEYQTRFGSKPNATQAYRDSVLVAA